MLWPICVGFQVRTAAFAHARETFVEADGGPISCAGSFLRWGHASNSLVGATKIAYSVPVVGHAVRRQRYLTEQTNQIKQTQKVFSCGTFFACNIYIQNRLAEPLCEEPFKNYETRLSGFCLFDHKMPSGFRMCRDSCHLPRAENSPSTRIFLEPRHFVWQMKTIQWTFGAVKGLVFPSKPNRYLQQVVFGLTSYQLWLSPT